MKAAVKCKLLLYADDSALLASSSDVSEIEDVLSRELESVSEWLVENRLSLHLGKTESILFGSYKRLAKRRECTAVYIAIKVSRHTKNSRHFDSVLFNLDFLSRLVLFHYNE